MTRCFISALMLLYAFVKLVLMGIGAYTGSLPMPMAIYLISGAVCVLLIAVGILGLLGRAGAGSIRSALLVMAVGAVVNMILLFGDPIPTGASVADLVISGTLFDSLAFLLSFGVRIYRGHALSLAEVRAKFRAVRRSSEESASPRHLRAAGR